MCVRVRAYVRVHVHIPIAFNPAAKREDLGCGWAGGEPPPLHDHELADVGQLVFAPLVKPLADGSP